jgi:hypothetical protein
MKVSAADTSIVEQISPAGHAPPHRGPLATSPPVAAQGVGTSGRQRQEVVGPAATVAQQLSPGGHGPPQPG